MNYSNLWGNVYLVWTQAGFNQSVYHYFGGTKDIAPAYGRKQLRECVTNYPREYPSIITIENNMFDQCRVFIRCKPVHEVTAILKEHGIDLYPEQI